MRLPDDASPLVAGAAPGAAGAVTQPVAAAARTRPATAAWTAGAGVVAALVAAPLLTLVWLALTPSAPIWDHLAATVLPHYLRTTALLMAGVGAGTLVIGVATAWLVTVCRFPGRRLFEWALLLPLAVPAYVIAYVYTDLLEYAGPVQRLLRDLAGWQSAADYRFPEIRSLGGAIAMMTLVLYPYVYLLARAGFLAQSVAALEVGRTLGLGPWSGFFRIALPLARPAIVVGVSLALMETLNDFGTVDFFAVATFTAGIYDVWLNMNNVGGAAQLSLLLLGFVFALIAAERLARRGGRVHATSTQQRPLPPVQLAGGPAVLAVLGCGLPPLLGFALPAAVLARYALATATVEGRFLVAAGNSLMLATIAAVIAVAVGVFLAYGQRLAASPGLRIAVRVAGSGYAVPGAVLAVAVLVPVAALDNAVDGFARATLGVSTGLILSGTIAALLYAYTARFLALSLGSAEAGLARVTPAMDGAARTLGCSPGATLMRVHLPMIRGSLLTAATLVFVDTLKELPITVLLRPFDFETLATSVHQVASAGLLAESAPGALAIVAAGILPVIALSRGIARSGPAANTGNRRSG